MNIREIKILVASIDQGKYLGILPLTTEWHYDFCRVLRFQSTFSDLGQLLLGQLLLGRVLLISFMISFMGAHGVYIIFLLYGLNLLHYIYLSFIAAQVLVVEVEL